MPETISRLNTGVCDVLHSPPGRRRDVCLWLAADGLAAAAAKILSVKTVLLLGVSSRNSRKHGLAALTCRQPAASADIERLATERAISLFGKVRVNHKVARFRSGQYDRSTRASRCA